MNIFQLRKLAAGEEVDYQFLMSALGEYAQPRAKINQWLKSGDLIRVKKGLYVFGKAASEEPYALEILANLIYGPSAISCMYALAYYGLVPERVNLVTSVTNKRNKTFTTPVGEFAYYYLSRDKYPIGIEIQQTASGKNFVIASPEKALCDQIHCIERAYKMESISDIEFYLVDDLRIDEAELKTLRLGQLRAVSNRYQNPKLNWLVKLIEKVKKNG